MREENYALLKWAQKDLPPEKHDTVRYFGIYRGIRFEINSFHNNIFEEIKKCWTHYLWIEIDNQVAVEHKEKFWLKPDYRVPYEGGREHVYYDYYSGLVGEITFHGGITFYSKESSPDDKERVVKIGCDYQHLWDEGNEYSLEYVYGQVKESIDSLITLIGEVKIRSLGDGKFRLLSEYEVTT